MSLQDVKRQYLITDSQGVALSPAIPDFLFEDSFCTNWNQVNVAASAVDATLPISDIGTVKLLELRVVPDDISKLTVKYNGSTTAYPVSPIDITSETISGITVSNSTTSIVPLYWRAISG